MREDDMGYEGRVNLEGAFESPKRQDRQVFQGDFLETGIACWVKQVILLEARIYLCVLSALAVSTAVLG